MSQGQENSMSGKGQQIEIQLLKAKNLKWVINLKGQKRQENREVITANCYIECAIYHGIVQDL